MLFYGPELKKQIFSYKICLPFVWITLIKGRLTNHFFPRNSCGRFFETPSPLTEKRQPPKVPKNQFFKT